MTKSRTSKIYNAFLAWLSYYQKRDKVLNPPRINNIEVTNRCNIRCIICPREDLSRPIGDMDLDSFKNIVAMCEKYTDKIGFCGFGEPLLNKDIVAMVEHCYQKKLYSRVTTNGTLLSERTAQLLVDAHLNEIVIALDGVGKTYNRIRKGADFDQVCDNIENIMKISSSNKSSKTKVMISIVEMEETKEQIAQLKEKWEPKADQIMIRPINDRDGAQKDLSKIANADKNNKRKYPCTFLWWEVAILWNGDIISCCVDWDGKYILGNIKEDPLLDIWNNEKARAIRIQHINGEFDKISLCSNCTLGFDSPTPKIASNPLCMDFLKVTARVFQKHI